MSVDRTDRSVTDPAIEDAPADVETPEPTIAEAVREQIGGPRGLIESAIPVTVFIIANMATPLWSALGFDKPLKPAIASAVGAAIFIAIGRLWRRGSIRHAVNGLIGVGIAAFFAARSGRAEDFYLPGIVISYVEGLAFAVSALIRRPIVGYAWALLTGAHPNWRHHPKLVRAYGLITLVWTAAFWTNSSIQLALYYGGHENALGVARLLGRAFYVAAFAFTIWYGRRAVRNERTATAQAVA